MPMRKCKSSKGSEARKGRVLFGENCSVSGSA